jgi:Domain of unknown function (DUF6777)
MRRAAVLLAGVVLAVALVACGSSGPAGSGGGQTQTVHFQKPLDPGPSPFTAPAAVRGRVTQPISEPFGGSGSNSVCDRDKLIRFLHAHSDRMLEWARVLHVQPTLPAVKRYIAKLHPVTLTRDTQVTNHAWKNGRAVPFQAILQAGTAVLVDRYGRPVVRCFCGNPLGPAVYTPTSKCVDCPPHYQPPRQCQYGRFDNYDVVYYRRTYYSNEAYDETFIRLSRRGRYRNCYAAYPDPPTVTIVDVYYNAPPPPAEPTPAEAPPPASTTTPHDDGLHCNPPRSQLEFEQCNGMGEDQHQTPQTNHTPTPQHSPTPTQPEPAPNLPQIGECNNGVDDDGDGMTDMGDPGCSGPNDQSE